MTADSPVITGLGVVSAAGIGTGEFWRGLHDGTPRFREVSLFPTDTLPHHTAAQIGPWTPGFDPGLGASARGGHRTAAFALAALDEAIADAGLGGIRPDRILVGTTVGDVADLEHSRREAARTGTGDPVPLHVDRSLRDRVSNHLGGPVPTELIVTACAAGNMALIRAAQLIAAGADVVICGGAESLSRMAFTGFSRMRGMARERCRPFSDDRDGLLLGEGAAFLVVESAAHASARGATVRAAVAGYGLTCDAKHPAAPDPTGTGVARAMAMAMAAAETDPADVSYVCAHGTGTPQNDAAEAAAYRQVFTGTRPPISSIKALIGHALGAASAIEAVACTLVLGNRRTVPQWGLDGHRTSLGIRPATGDRTESAGVDLVLNNAFAFGGNNTSVALRRAGTGQRVTTA